jgi:osmotically-inducible protein OsmY
MYSFIRHGIAMLFIVSLTACGVFGGQETTGQYVDDATITTRVKARFAEAPEVSALRLGVETMQGTVQLSGFAASADEKRRAVQIAREVPGVRDVRDSVVIQPAKK